MGNFTSRRTLGVLVAIAVALAATIGGLLATSGDSSGSTKTRITLKQLQYESQGAESGPGGESNDYLTAQTQFAEARTAPEGIVDPGAYSSALGQLTGLKTVGGAWTNITAVKYDADHPAYRDYFSNSSGGSGLVTGRITGLAADASGDIWAAGADGGVWRHQAGHDTPYWTAISDGLLSLSSGDLEYSGGKLWYATGEANTGGTSYVGAGVYVLSSPATSTSWTRVGGSELESTTIGKLRFSDSKVWAATLRGVWSHNLTDTTTNWTLSYAPHPENLPASLKPYAQTASLAAAIGAGSSSSTTNAPYKNIANDVAIDPTNANHIIAAIGWRSGDSYNGFYETTNGGNTWVKVNPTGSIPASDIGYVTFAYSAHGEKLYAINQSPALLNKFTGTVNSYLDGIYVSNNGSIAGPWSKIADSTKLANSGSALKQAVSGKGYGPGIQAWYNQFLAVDPNDPNHVYAGLEEVYETTNGGSTWTTPGPYWNFYFSCWNPNVLYPPDGASGANGCPQTTHSDQHSVAIGGSGGNAFVVVGNDGGVYKRPLNGSTNSNGNATDWTSLNDGSIDALQYYAVGIGKINHTAHTASGQTVDENTLPVVGTSAPGGVLVSGGLQDNGGSLLRPGASTMVSNFGGDGGDVLVDPNDGCNIVQEYVVLSMSVTQTCAHPDPSVHPDAFLDLSQSTTFKIGPPDINARFIAPFVANKQNINEWLAGGNHLWVQENGFAIRSGAEWGQPIYSFGGSGVRVATAVSMNGNIAIASWCGPCNNSGFARGIAIGTKGVNGKWTFAEPLSGTNATTVAGSDPLTQSGFPRRYIGGVAAAKDGTLYAAVGGFSRHFTEGEGAGYGHVFMSTDKGATWQDISDQATTKFPDVPANSVQALDDGTLVVGTDLGVVIRQPGATTWNRVGTNLPLTVAMDVELGPDGNIYAATHGRGIWSIPNPTAAPTTTTTTPTAPKKK
ncbi:MAG: glycosyl hydrolase [Actinomycetia bacterium]|nr:glycosyl hydrolase [Actinomycetes bacterium]